MGMFEQASRLKLRFDSAVGNVTIEDLWDSPLINPRGASLDNIAKKINRDLKASDEDSFVLQKTSINKILELKLSIVKHIIAVKLEEIEIKENAVLRKDKKDKILSIIADKEDDNLKNSSVEELKKMVSNL